MHKIINLTTEKFEISIREICDIVYDVTAFENIGVCGIHFTVSILDASDKSHFLLQPADFWKNFFSIDILEDSEIKWPLLPYDIKNILFEVEETLKYLSTSKDA